MEKQRKYSENPGQTVYPNLEEPICVEGLGLSDSPEIVVEGGNVIFSRWSSHLGDRVSFVITEWDFGQFVEQWVSARLEQKFLSKEEQG